MNKFVTFPKKLDDKYAVDKKNRKVKDYCHYAGKYYALYTAYAI